MAATAHLAPLHDAQQAAALLDPVRLRIMEHLQEPGSAAGVARQLRMPRQKINYHLRELEKRGLLELVEERRRGNCTERLLRATARSYLITPGVLGALGADPSRVADRFSSSYLVALAAKVIADLATLQQEAAAADKKLATLSLHTEIRFANAAARHRFAEELAQCIADLAAKYHDEHAEGGRRFQFVMGVYPARAKKEGEASSSPARARTAIPISWRSHD